MTHYSPMDSYSDEAVRHFMHPRNTERVDGANGIGCATSDRLEDLIELSIRVDADETIVGVRCRTFGCVAAVACGSAFSDLLRGKTIAEATRISPTEVLDALGGLPHRRRCFAKLPLLALQAALENYRERRVAIAQGSPRRFHHRHARGLPGRPGASGLTPTVGTVDVPAGRGAAHSSTPQAQHLGGTHSAQYD